MPSNAYTTHLHQLLMDAEDLDDCHTQLRTGTPGRQYGIAALNRAAVVMSVSAWESYIEQLMRESLAVLQPVPPAAPGTWPALSAYITGAAARFNTPNAANVARLIRECVGLPDVTSSWIWKNTPAVQAVRRLDDALDYRHQIAHGVNPRPTIHHHYSSRLPQFFRRLARCTDDAVRTHLVHTHGVAIPWPI
jgi:hypothetical protein